MAASEYYLLEPSKSDSFEEKSAKINLSEDYLLEADAKGQSKSFSIQNVQEPSQRLFKVDVDMSRYILTPNDTNDPSYTNLTLPYSTVCRQRYKKAGAAQKAQFIKEIKAHELLRVKALDGVRIHREFCNPLLCPISQGELITLTKRQQERIEQLLNEP